MIDVYARTFDSDEDPCKWTPQQGGEWAALMVLPGCVLLREENNQSILIPYTSIDNISFGPGDNVIFRFDTTGQ